MRVRTATVADAEGIVRVARAAYRAAYPEAIGSEATEELLAEWYTVEAIRDRVRDGGRTRVATVDGAGGRADREGGRVVGFASGGDWDADDRGPGDAVLGTLYVHPDRWGEGVGGRLYDDVRAECRDRGFDRLWIHVFAANDVGRGFYEDRAEFVETTVDELVGREFEVAVYVDRLGG